MLAVNMRSNECTRSLFYYESEVSLWVHNGQLFLMSCLVPKLSQLPFISGRQSQFPQRHRHCNMHYAVIYDGLQGNGLQDWDSFGFCERSGRKSKTQNFKFAVSKLLANGSDRINLAIPNRQSSHFEN